MIRGTLKRPPQGWLDLIQIAKEIGGRKINLIKKELESHRAAHPKDINIFKMGDLAGRSSLMRECYSPVLVQLIKQKFKTKNK